MERSNLLRSISIDIDTFKAHLKRVSKDGYKFHELDKDLLLQKTRELYDNILKIELEGDNIALSSYVKPEIKPTTHEAKTEPKKEVVIEEKIEEKETVVELELPKKEENIVKPPTKEVVVEEVKEEEFDVVIEPVKRESVLVQEVNQEKPIEKEVRQERIVEKPVQESNYDLFGSSSATVSDKFVDKEEKSLAEKLQQKSISDIRGGIGINEKFLFINELFNGDMGRYNKAIDELNSMQSKPGLDTYLMEMKIEKQWDIEMEAYIKFKEIVDRKFG